MAHIPNRIALPNGLYWEKDPKSGIKGGIYTERGFFIMPCEFRHAKELSKHLKSEVAEYLEVIQLFLDAVKGTPRINDAPRRIVSIESAEDAALRLLKAAGHA